MQFTRVPINPRCCKSNGLGFIDSLLSAAGSVFGGSGGGGGGSSGGQPITVSPQISTQISPSISPVFQQQFQPTNSAATAGTASSPSFGAPGFAPDGSYIPGGAPMPVNLPVPVAPNLPAQSAKFPSWAPWAILGAGVAGYFLLRKKRAS